MTTGEGESGYVLASVLAALIPLSIVAAALVAGSSQTLRQVRQEELLVTHRLDLDSVLLVAASEAVREPRQRALSLSEGPARLSAPSGAEYSVAASWEIDRLDLNRAEFSAIDDYLGGLSLRAGLRETLNNAVQDARMPRKPIRLVADLALDRSTQECANYLFTVFGGQADPKAMRPHAFIGQPGPGAMIRIEVWSESGPGGAMVVLATGKPQPAFLVLDKWDLWLSREEACSDETP